MSSLTRARSLRKPAGATALPPSDRSKERNQDPSRNASPSRLPMKPTSTATSRAPSSSATRPTRSTSGRINRPGSSSSNASSVTTVAAPRRAASLGKRTTTAATTTTTSAPSTSQTTTTTTSTRKEGSRYPPLTSTTRPVSMVMRNASDGSTTSTGTRRTTPTTATTRATVMTPSKSNTATGRGTVPPAVATPLTSQERKSRSRPPSRDQSASTTSQGPPPPGTPKRRAISVDTPPPPTTPIATTTTAAAAPRLNRPAFSTHQQRFSPAKTGGPNKPPTATYTAPPSPSKLPANIAASAETSRLQAELLQLHLLHRDAARVEAQWRASAKSKLGDRFRAVRDAHRHLADREAAEVEGDNIAALQQWSGGGSTLDDRVRVLDAVVGGAWMMSEPGGKYARVVRRFERWIERVMDLEEARESGVVGVHRQSTGSNCNGAGGGGVEEALFIQDLDAAWTDECMSMTRKLEGWQAQLESSTAHVANGSMTMGSTATTGSRSSLERMLEGSRALIEDMLSELSAMEEIRQAALAREEDWIERMNRDDDDNDTPRAGAVWRAI